MFSSLKNRFFHKKEQDQTLHLIRKMDLFAIITASLMSDEFRETVGKTTFEKHPWLVRDIEVRFDNDGVDKIIVRYNKNYYPFSFYAVPPGDPRIRTAVRESEFASDNFYLAGTKGLVKFLAILTKCLYKPLTSVNFNDPQRDIRDLCDFPEVFNVDKIIINKPSVKKEELDFISENFHNIKTICFHTNAPKGMEDFPLRYHTVCIDNDSLIKVDQLISMKSVYVEILNTKNITISDMDLFVKYWKCTGLPRNLSKLLIANLTPDHPGDSIVDMILSQKPFLFDPINHGRYFPQYPFGFYDTKDLLDVKGRDGTIATMSGYNKNIFMFLVWKERFPKLAECYIQLIERMENEEKRPEDKSTENSRLVSNVEEEQFGIAMHRFYEPKKSESKKALFEQEPIS